MLLDPPTACPRSNTRSRPRASCEDDHARQHARQERQPGEALGVHGERGRGVTRPSSGRVQRICRADPSAVRHNRMSTSDATHLLNSKCPRWTAAGHPVGRTSRWAPQSGFLDGQWRRAAWAQMIPTAGQRMDGSSTGSPQRTEWTERAKKTELVKFMLSDGKSGDEAHTG